MFRGSISYVGSSPKIRKDGGLPNAWRARTFHPLRSNTSVSLVGVQRAEYLGPSAPYSKGKARLALAFPSSLGKLHLIPVSLTHAIRPDHKPSAATSHYNFSTGGGIADRCLDAFTVALNQAWDGEPWYAPTKDLQLASLAFCAACRSVATLHLKVDDDTPGQLLAPPPLDHEEQRVPRLLARRVTWMLPTTEMLSKSIYAVADARVWAFGVFFNDSLDEMVWPRRLSKLVLGDRFSNGRRWAGEFRKSFNMPITGVEWPTCLQSIVFGGRFDQPVVGVKWPPSLKQVTFGVFFNQPIAEAAWPASIEEMRFGMWFNQPVKDVSWPPCLKKLVLGDRFNQLLDGVNWPALLEIEFGQDFSQSINEVVWPSVQRVNFDRFAYNLENVTLPNSLKRIDFGESFDQCLDNAKWPPSLEEVVFGHHFCQPISSTAWPSSLRKLTLGAEFNWPLHGIGAWIPSLVELTLHADRSYYRHRLSGISWPKGLKVLTLHSSWDANRKREDWEDARILRGVKQIGFPPHVEVIYRSSFYEGETPW